MDHQYFADDKHSWPIATIILISLRDYYMVLTPRPQKLKRVGFYATFLPIKPPVFIDWSTTSNYPMETHQ
jgi:hypothetical protein